MNLLIIGGLLAVGIVAILGAVLLGMSEQRAEEARKNHVPQTIPAARSEPAVRRPNLPAGGEKALATIEREELHTSLNGQFHELAGEIRTLHQQAQQLEQRLGVLAEMVDHIEQSQSGYTGIEEEAQISSDHSIT